MNGFFFNWAGKVAVSWKNQFENGSFRENRWSFVEFFGDKIICLKWKTREFLRIFSKKIRKFLSNFPENFPETTSQTVKLFDSWMRYWLKLNWQSCDSRHARTCSISSALFLLLDQFAGQNDSLNLWRAFVNLQTKHKQHVFVAWKTQPFCVATW